MNKPYSRYFNTIPGQLGQQSPGLVTGIAPSGQLGQPQAILAHGLAADKERIHGAYKNQQFTSRQNFPLLTRGLMVTAELITNCWLEEVLQNLLGEILL